MLFYVYPTTPPEYAKCITDFAGFQGDPMLWNDCVSDPKSAIVIFQWKAQWSNKAYYDCGVIWKI